MQCGTDADRMPIAMRSVCEAMPEVEVENYSFNSPPIPTSPTSTRGPRALPDTERFQRLIRVDDNGCHLWQGMLMNGQGYFKAGTWNDQHTKLAHRFAWEQIHGPLPKTQPLEHTCGVRTCCNPEHLAFRTKRAAQPRNVAVDGITEKTMLDLLHRRYGASSMGARRYAVAEHVADTTGWANRIADFIAVDCYSAQRPRLPLRWEIHGHEIKVSRGDWLTELRDPTKAEAFRPYVHRWWLVVADRRIVRDGELPEGWGLLVKAGSRLVTAHPAPLLEPEAMPNGMLASLLRTTAKTAVRRSR